LVRRQRDNPNAAEETPSFLAAAATSLARFQTLFNLATSNADDDVDEVFCIWGEDDTPEKHQERIAAMEQARACDSARLPHHAVLRRRKGASPGNKAPDDPFLLDLS